jgi:hypothetical protein
MIPLGNTVVLTATFRDLDGRLMDPDTVRCRVVRRIDDAEVSTYVHGTDDELTRKALGIFQLRIVPDEPGAWIYRFEGSGVIECAQEGTFNISKSLIPD